MSSTQPSYRAYLLRLCQAPEARWWASLEDAHTGERQIFATLAQFIAFLEKQVGDQHSTEPAAKPDAKSDHET